MLGKIIGIDENVVLVQLGEGTYNQFNIIDLYVVLNDNSNCLVGEIRTIKDGIAYIDLLGEIVNGRFFNGTCVKPSFSATVELLSHANVKSIIGLNNGLPVGKSVIYKDIDIGMDINDFFSHHFAIFGSTGSGKSCSIARILQNLFQRENHVPNNASILLFDAYGEYHNVFESLNKQVPSLCFKKYTANTKDDANIIKIPLWLLTVDDIALLLDISSYNQLPIVEKAMRLVTVFAQEEDVVLNSKNDIIARTLLDILSSGKPASQIRDQIMSILSRYNTRSLNLDTEIYQPGYTRPLRQCLLIDATGKLSEMALLTNFIQNFVNEGLELSLPDGSFKYTLFDLYTAIEFALISEGILKSDRVYDEYNTLKVRLNSLLNSDYSAFFDVPSYITKENYIHSILTKENGEKAQIINFNINYIDDRFAKIIVKIYSKLFFDYAKELEERASEPIHIILEEAHRYVQNDNDINILGYNIFDRITKEGRKYGILLGLISQRPAELSSTALSQCSNFLIFRIIHPGDINFISEVVSNMGLEMIKKIKILPSGHCIVFGTAFKMSTLVKLEMPNPAPASASCNINERWYLTK